MCCHGNSLSGDCGCPMFLSNVCCQTQEQENCHLCPSSAAPLTVPPSDRVLAAETHVALALFQPNNRLPEALSLTLHRWSLITNVSLVCCPYLHEGHIIVTQCLLLTIWGRNLAGVTRILIWISDTALNLFYKQACDPFFYRLFISLGSLTMSNMLRVLRQRSDCISSRLFSAPSKCCAVWYVLIISHIKQQETCLCCFFDRLLSLLNGDNYRNCTLVQQVSFTEQMFSSNERSLLHKLPY